MKVRYNGEGGATLAHKGAGALGQFGIDGTLYLFNAGQWIEITNPADVQFYKDASKPKGSVWEIEKPEAIANKIVDSAKKTVGAIKAAVTGHSKCEDEAEASKKETENKKARKGALTTHDLPKK